MKRKNCFFRVIGALFCLYAASKAIGALARRLFHRGMTVEDGVCTCTVVCNGLQTGYPNEELSGARLSAVLGGIELDLSGAVMTQDIVIHITAVLGGVVVRVPDHVYVKINPVSVLGSSVNQTEPPLDPGAPVIYVQATCVCGGVVFK